MYNPFYLMHHNLKFVAIGCAVRLLGRYRQKRRDRDRRMYVGRDPHIFRRGRQAEPGKRLTGSERIHIRQAHG